MGGQIARDSNKNMTTLVAIAPFAKLLHTRLEHLVCVKPRILAQQCKRKRRDKGLGRVTKDEVAGNEPCGGIDLVLVVKGIEQSRADFLGSNGQFIESSAGLTRQGCWWNVQVSSEIKRHSPMQETAHGFDRSSRDGRLAADPLEGLVNGVCIGEDVVSSLPVGVLIGGAEARNPECCRIGKRPTEIAGRGPSLRCGFERIDDRTGIVGKQALG